MLHVQHPSLSALIHDMNEVIARYDTPLDRALATTERVGRLLENADIEGQFTAPCRDHYARYKIYQHPDDRFCIVAMAWGPGQGTGLHDHGGVWCVEGVYRGRMHITRYELDSIDGDLYRFHASEDISAGAGAVGNLVPPSEYHDMRNLEDVPAISIHVYGRELKQINKYVPTGDGVHHVRQEVRLGYDHEGA